ncbi:MAG: helicase, partial [Odoribacter sp.]|nr:helicase [Odoribacter sp.]
MAGRINSSLADLQKQFALLQKEYEHEREMYRGQAERSGIRQRIMQGGCWYPVHTGKSGYNSLNQLTVEVHRNEPDDTETLFEYGRPVCFFKVEADGTLRYFTFSSVISYVRENTMVVVLPGVQALAELNVAVDLGVQLYFDDTSYKTMFAALKEVMGAKDNRLAFLREVLLGNGIPSERGLQPLRLPWLNTSQEKAVNRVLAARDVA